MTATTNAPAQTAADNYCDCPRSGDMWRCLSGYSLCRQDGKDCALLATTDVTGQDRWTPAAESAIKARPCRCGGAKRS